MLEHTERYRFAGKYVKGKQVIELGCGTGYGSSILAQAGAKKVIALDISTDAITYAKKHFPHKNVQYLVSSAEKTPLPEKSADVVVSFETIEHVPHPDTFIKEAMRLLKDSGLCIISTPNAQTSFGDNPYHLKEFTVQELDVLLSKFTNRKYFGQRKVTYPLVMLYKKLLPFILFSSMRMLLRFRPWENYAIKPIRRGLKIPYLYLVVVCQK